MELLLKEAGFLELRASCSNAMEANKVLTQEDIDLIFLDIQMPKIRGIDFLRSLSDPPLVIITTAYPNFALEGFELDVLDYLVKPISFQRFVKAVGKAREYYSGRTPAMVAVGEGAAPDHLFIKSGNSLQKINYSEILFIEALQNYVAIHTKGKKYITYVTFKAIGDHLPPDRFLKVHKSYIIQISQVDSIEDHAIIIGQASIPISRANREEILGKILNGRFLKR